MKDIRAAYITPEIGISHLDYYFPMTYSGGLGYLGHSFARSAHCLGLPLAIVSMLPRDGYYHQEIEGDQMVARYALQDFEGLLEEVTTLTIQICHNPYVHVRVWKVPDRYEMGSVFLLDTDIPENDGMSRMNTRQLYGGSRITGRNMDRMIAQSVVLGKGAVALMRYLNAPVEKFHVNESHGFFVPIALIEEAMAKGMSTDRAIAYARARTVFTTHTPIGAGNPVYKFTPTYDGIRGIVVMGGIKDSALWDYLYHIGGGEEFNTTAACLSMASYANAVSKKHLETAKRQWSWVQGAAPLIAITNGVDPSYWQPEEFRNAGTAQELQEAKCVNVRLLLNYIRDETGRYWHENIPIIVWARRFAEYKRPELITADERWFNRMMKTNRFQLIMAGRPHPDDFERIHAWNRLYRKSLGYHNMVVLPNYDMRMSRILKTGAHVWLNNPRVPEEACGTSWEGAGFVGALNASTPDGGIAELDPEHYVRFGTSFSTAHYEQDARDAQGQRMAIGRICRMWRRNQNEWWEKALNARDEIVSHFNSDSMVRKYWTELYGFAK